MSGSSKTRSSNNLFAALGGLFWPIEVTPGWMRAIQKIVPTGWTMDALHNLISFQAGAFGVAVRFTASNCFSDFVVEC